MSRQPRGTTRLKDTGGKVVFNFSKNQNVVFEIQNSLIWSNDFKERKTLWKEFKNHKIDPKKSKEEEDAISKIATPFQKNRVDFLLSKLVETHPHMYFQTQPNKEPIKVR